MNKLMTLGLVLNLLSIAPSYAKGFKSISVNDGIEVLNNRSFSAESVAISDDGEKICWIAKSKDSKIVIPSDVFYRDLGDKKVKRLDKHGFLNAFTKCSFDQDNNLVTSKLHWRPLALSRTIIMGLLKGEFDPIGYASSITKMDENQKVLSAIMPKSLDLKSDRIFLKHPRYSPDGKWLTYYLKHGKKLEGVYLHHIATGKTHQLSAGYDKHPTWSPEGDKILFHFQIDATETNPEQAYLGYFDLELNDNGDVKSSSRIMLDDIEKVGFRYQKHPAMLAGTDFVFFHGEEEAGDKKDLFVRELKPGSKTYKLKLKLNDLKITKAKHPASGAFDNKIVFIGKVKDTNEDQVLMLSPKAIDNILNAIE